MRLSTMLHIARQGDGVKGERIAHQGDSQGGKGASCEAVRKLIMCKVSFHSRKLCFHCENFQGNVVTLQQWSKEEAESEKERGAAVC